MEAAAQAVAGPPGPALLLAGALPRPGRWPPEALRQLGEREAGPFELQCFTGRPIGRLEAARGVRLIDVLDAGGFSMQPRALRKRCIVAAVAADGYRALFSWNELYNGPIGAGVLVIWAQQGQALAPPLGPLALLSAHDHRLGPRHLHGLERIEVHAL
ncbi:molybdopterin-binding protein [Piscinibacter sakaiensis]|uniref:Oxidoreductase molybdopterin-binding domain-containing protein n=2 Tax=Piscinibacter sakaiensis TaxID=1547922 RepID=A0A0K8NYI4_PISS1|nr:hypothetical protein ISF6_0535 [Piscinibacter sakaiensis]